MAYSATQAIPSNNPPMAERPLKGGFIAKAQANETEARVSPMAKVDRETSKARQEQDMAPLFGLASHIKNAWQAAQNSKRTWIDHRLLQAQRQRKGEYDPDRLARIQKFGGSDVYMMLTNVKCRAAEAWIRDIMIPPGDKPWSIEPTPIPELPQAQEVKIVEQVTFETSTLMMQGGMQSVTPDQIADRLQEIKDEVLEEKIRNAKAATTDMETSIEDDLREGKYYTALGEFITDLCTFPTAFMKGPVIRRRKNLVWTEDQQGNWVPAVEVVPKREWQRCSPYNIYPSPGARNIQDGYLLERHQLRRSDLTAMIGVDGFSETAIRGVLDQFGRGGLREWIAIDQERADIEERHNEWDDPDPPIDALEYWGPVQGRYLLEWGMDKAKVKDPLMDYQVTAWLIGGWVIMARLNASPLGTRPYYSASFEEVADSIWGLCPGDLMRDLQELCNGIARAMANNLGIASGPQVEIEMNRVQPGEDVEDIYPWKIWKTMSDPNGKAGHAVQFYQPNPMTDQLIKTYEYFFQQASEQTGIPNYIYGQSNVGGAGSTASGLSMLMNAASKTLKDVISHLDEGVIKPSIRDIWINKMLYDNEQIKHGDIQIIARASDHLIIAEQLELRRNEFMKSTMNPIDQQIIGIPGRATLLRESAKGLKLSEDVVPSKKDMEAAMAPPASPGQAMGPPGGPPMGIPEGMPPAAMAQQVAGGPNAGAPGEMVRPAA